MKAVVLYAGLTVMVTPASTPRVVADDLDDDHVIAAALAGGADVIVSGDRHLLSLGLHLGVRILAPDAALVGLASRGGWELAPTRVCLGARFEASGYAGSVAAGDSVGMAVTRKAVRASLRLAGLSTL